MCKKNNRVIIVDDDWSTIEILKNLVEELGYQSFCFDSVDGAKSQFDKINPTLVVTDLWLPNNNGNLDKLGYKLAKWIKKKDEFCPVIVLSSETDLLTRAYYIACGVSLFESKPLDKISLSVKIMKLSNIARVQKLDSKQLKQEYGDVNNVECKRDLPNVSWQRR